MGESIGDGKTGTGFLFFFFSFSGRLEAERPVSVLRQDPKRKKRKKENPSPFFRS
jgi:hypothetical protein